MSTFELILIVELGVIFFLLVGLLVALQVAVRKMAATTEKLHGQTDPLMHQTREALTSVKPMLDQTRETLVNLKPLLEQMQDTLASAKPLIEQARTTAAQVGPVLEQTNQILATTRETTVLAKQAVGSLKTEAEACMAAVTTTTREIVKLTEDEVRQVQALVSDASGKVRLQIERFDSVATRTALRIDDTAALVQRDVLRPITEISAVLAASKSFLEVLFSAERKQIDQAYQDEEMFI